MPQKVLHRSQKLYQIDRCTSTAGPRPPSVPYKLYANCKLNSIAVIGADLGTLC